MTDPLNNATKNNELSPDGQKLDQKEIEAQTPQIGGRKKLRAIPDIPLDCQKWVMDYKKNIPKMYIGQYERAMKGQSKALALKVKCLDCCCFIRAEVEHCTVYTCPLWPYRPYQGKRSKKYHV